MVDVKKVRVKEGRIDVSQEKIKRDLIGMTGVVTGLLLVAVGISRAPIFLIFGGILTTISLIYWTRTPKWRR